MPAEIAPPGRIPGRSVSSRAPLGAGSRETKAVLLVLLSLLLVAPLAHGEGKALLHEKTYRLGVSSSLLVGDGRTGPYLLPHAPILRGSETVSLYGTALVREKDYWIRPEAGEVTFASPLLPGTAAEVRYRYLPISIPLERSLHKLRLSEGEEETLLPPASPRAMSGPLDTGALRVGGTKSFSVVIGSDRALTLEQALRMSVTGNLAPDVRVTAQLTDQNLPFQAEGRSERLEELDQVLVHVESPRVEATLGDYEVHFAETEFGRYDRVLKGALAKWKGSDYEAEGSAGLSKGTFRSVEIRGVEGKQGPYALLEVSPLGQVVVAGSEQVWLNGAKMTRGDDNDYVIDYAAGTITMNPGRPISSGSRIAVDFQTSGDEYRRSFVTGRFRAGSDEDRLRLRGTILSEQDDEGEQEAIVLGEEETDSLRVSGDRQPLGSSARYVEEGGDYDTTGGVFVYAGADSGAFVVSFREVPAGGGRYADSVSTFWGERIFVFVGEGKGNYEPTVPVPLPSAQRLFVLSGGARPWKGLDLGAEGAWSDLDRNTLSSRDDGDNKGGALLLSARLAEAALRPGGSDAGSLELGAEHRQVTEQFVTLGRYREPHRDERWMTADLRRAIGPGRKEDDRVGSGEAFASRGEESSTTGNGAYQREIGVGKLSLTGEGGSFRASGFDSVRWSWRSALEKGDRYRASYGEERIAADEADSLRGETLVRSAESSFRLFSFRPSAGVKRARRSYDRDGVLRQGTRDREEKVGLFFDRGAFQAGGSVAFQESDYGDSARAAWLHWYDGRTDEASLRWRGPITALASYTHRAVEYGETVTEGNTRSDLGRLELRHGGFDGAIQASWDYEVTTEERKSRTRLLLRAPAGQGADYDSLGNYFPHEGTFHQVIVEGEPEPVVDLEAGVTIRVEPGRRRGASADSWWNAVAGETFLRVEERSTTSDRTGLLLLQPGAFQRNDATLRGSTVIRQEVRWTAPGSKGSFRLRFQREDREENEFRDLNRDDLVRTLLLRAQAPIAAHVTGELEWTRRLEEEDSNDERAVDLTADEWKATLLYDPTPRWRFRFPASLEDDREAVRHEAVRSVRLEPEAAVNLAAQSRLDMGFDWSRFLEASLDRAGSFLRDRKEGLRWRVQLAYEWNTVFSSSLVYTGESLKGDPSTQQLRAEMRAFF